MCMTLWCSFSLGTFWRPKKSCRLFEDKKSSMTFGHPFPPHFCLRSFLDEVGKRTVLLYRGIWAKKYGKNNRMCIAYLRRIPLGIIRRMRSVLPNLFLFKNRQLVMASKFMAIKSSPNTITVSCNLLIIFQNIKINEFFTMFVHSKKLLWRNYCSLSNGECILTLSSQPSTIIPHKKTHITV